MKQSLDGNSEKLERYLRAIVETFTKRTQSVARKNFLILLSIYISIALLGFLLFFSLAVLASPLLTAFSLSGLLLTLFGGYIYHRYSSLQRPNRYRELAHQFTAECTQSIPFQPGTPAFHTTIGMANALLADQLHDKEYTYFACKYFPKAVAPLAENLGAVIFWRDLFLFREILLQNSVEECLHLVRTDPIHLTYHSQLANAYVLLSRLYRDPRLDVNREERHWLSKERYNKKMEEKYRHATEKAIEEFKIISSYAPDDPWVLSQLAVSYKDLGLPFEEIHACEALLRLCPSETETLHRLGSLYFKLGANAKGLEVYRQLCHIDCTLAVNLISQYGNN